jgi:xylulokinase
LLHKNVFRFENSGNSSYIGVSVLDIQLSFLYILLIPKRVLIKFGDGRMKAVLAYDLGGTSLRAGLVDQVGKLVGPAVVKCALTIDERGFSEMDPEGWWKDLLHATDLLLDLPQASVIEVVGVCLGGITRTQVFLDGKGQPLRPAISWADSRATLEAEEIRVNQASMGLEGQTYGPINAFHPLARLVWLKKKEPDIFRQLASVVEPKDYLNFRLTGELASDVPAQARLLRRTDDRFAQELCMAVGLSPGLFPILLPPEEMVGRVKSGLPPPLDRLAGRPVLVGSMDAWLAALGIGANHAGRAFNISGTSEVLGLVTTKKVEAPGLVDLPWGFGLFQIGGPSQAGADCLAWLAELFGRTEPSALLNDLDSFARHQESVLFLPYLRGERVPLWKPGARGLFLGLNRNHGRNDLIWAVLEGVAMANRQVLSLAEKACGKPADEVRIGGGAARSETWCQIKADVLGRPVIRTENPEPGLLGAAMVAWVGLNKFNTFDEAESAMVKVERRFNFDPVRTQAYDRLFDLWLQVQAAVLPLTQALVETSLG